jgi:hypothetical protein
MLLVVFRCKQSMNLLFCFGLGIRKSYQTTRARPARRKRFRTIGKDRCNALVGASATTMASARLPRNFRDKLRLRRQGQVTRLAGAVAPLLASVLDVLCVLHSHMFQFAVFCLRFSCLVVCLFFVCLLAWFFVFAGSLRFGLQADTSKAPAKQASQ